MQVFSTQPLLTAIGVNQIRMQHAQIDLANTHNLSYCRHRVDIDTLVDSRTGLASGTVVRGIHRETSQFLNEQVLVAQQRTEELKVISDYRAEFHPFFGSPHSQDSLSSKIAHLENQIGALYNTPDDTTKRAVVASAVEATNSFNELSSNFQKLRVKADLEISDSVGEVNRLLRHYQKINESISTLVNRGRDPIDAKSKRDGLARELSKYLPIQEMPQADGKNQLILSTAGQLLLQDKYVAPIAFLHSPFISADMTLANGGLGGVILESQDVSDQITGGKIAGLLKVRDEVIKGFQDHMDQLAGTFRNEMNRVANKGVSCTGRQEIVSKILPDLPDNEICAPQGTLRVAVLDRVTREFVEVYDIDFAPPSVRRSSVSDEISDVFWETGNVTAEIGADDRRLRILATNPNHVVMLSSPDLTNPACDQNTGRGLMEFFGFNNIFEDSTMDGGISPGVARELQVSEYLQNHPEYFPTGTFYDQAKGGIVIQGGVGRATVGVEVGDVSLVNHMQNVSKRRVSFPTVGEHLAIDRKLREVSIDIVLSSAAQTEASKQNFETQKAHFDALLEEKAQLEGASEEEGLLLISSLTKNWEQMQATFLALHGNEQAMIHMFARAVGAK